jgi:hypothetical protein
MSADTYPLVPYPTLPLPGMATTEHLVGWIANFGGRIENLYKKLDPPSRIRKEGSEV